MSLTTQYDVDARFLNIRVPLEQIRRIAQTGMAAQEFKRVADSTLRVTDVDQLAETLVKVMEQEQCNPPGGEVNTVIEGFLDEMIYAAVEWGCDGVIVT